MNVHVQDSSYITANFVHFCAANQGKLDFCVSISFLVKSFQTILSSSKHAILFSAALVAAANKECAVKPKAAEWLRIVIWEIRVETGKLQCSDWFELVNKLLFSDSICINRQSTVHLQILSHSVSTILIPPVFSNLSAIDNNYAFQKFFF